MRRPLALVVVMAWAMATALLAIYYIQIGPLKHLDTVFLYESSLSVLESGRPTSPTWQSYVPDVLATFTMPAGDVCRLDLVKDTAPGYDILDNHAYLAIFPISLIVGMMGPEAAFAILNALAHALLVAIPFAYLIRQGAGLMAAAAFALLVAVYPVWSSSAVGDYYLDRLAMPFIMLSLFTLHLMVRHEERLRELRWLAAWVAASLAAALFTERAAVMVIGATGFFAVAFPSIRRSRRALATLGAVLIVLATYLWWYLTVIQSSTTGVSLLGSIDPANLGDRLASPQMLAFVTVNAIFMGPLVLLSGLRYAVLAVASMVPNILITTGGAELTGWETHYHAMYLPIVLFAAAIGFLALLQRARSRNVRALIVVGLSAYALAFAVVLDPATGGRDRPLADSFKRGVAYRLYRHYARSADVYAQLATSTRTLDAIVPTGARVSAVEAAMPALYRGRTLSMFPMNMDAADYIVVHGDLSDGRLASIEGAVSYLGPDVGIALNACLLERARMHGFELVDAIEGTDLVILGRVGPPGVL